MSITVEKAVYQVVLVIILKKVAKLFTKEIWQHYKRLLLFSYKIPVQEKKI